MSTFPNTSDTFEHSAMSIGGLSCDFLIGRGGIDDITNGLCELDGSSYFILCDEHIAQRFGSDLSAAMERHAPTYVLTHETGEGAKTLDVVQQLGDQAILRNVDRSSVIIGLGGGQTSNVAGLLASLLFRGIRLVHIPTTFLSMTDAVISLKQAVNSQHAKNVYGAFHQPTLSILNLSYLDSLPVGDFRSASCEITKNALIIQPDFLPRLEVILARLEDRHPDDLRELLEYAFSSKAKVLADDRFERGPALVCEYGHTVGHAIERVHGAPHGLAVGAGVLVAAEVSAAMGYLNQADLDTHYRVLGLNQDVVSLLKKADPNLLMREVAFDNKRGYLDLGADELAMVLLRALGDPLLSPDGRPLIPVPKTMIEQSIVTAQSRMTTLFAGATA